MANTATAETGAQEQHPSEQEQSHTVSPSTILAGEPDAVQPPDPIPAELVPVPEDEVWEDTAPAAGTIQQTDTAAADTAAAEASASAAAEARASTEPPVEQCQALPAAMDDEALPTLPQKRPYEAMTLVLEPNGNITRAGRHWDGSPPMSYGPKNKTFFKVYSTTHQRQQDLQGTDKQAQESDTTVDSDSTSPAGDNKHYTNKQKQHHSTGMSRQERKQLDREIPWRHILSMPAAYIDKSRGN